jgi:hypothetical protein
MVGGSANFGMRRIMKLLNIFLSAILLMALSSSVVIAQTVEYVSSYDTPAAARSVYVVGDYAYVALGSSGLQIVNVSNPDNPVYAGSYETSGSAYGVYVTGDYAYVAAGFSGLQVADVSNPENPVFAGSYDTPDRARSVYVSSDYAYVADRTSLQIINISDPENPVLAGSWGLPTSDFRSVYVSGDYAYIAELTNGLVVIDVSDPENPDLTGNCLTPGNSYDVCVSGDYVYLADGSSFQVLNVFIPANPFIFGSYDDLAEAMGVYYSDDYAYVADFDFGLHVIEVSNPPYISYASSFETTGNVYDVYVLGDYIYMAEESSLLILKYPRVDVEEDINVPQEFSLAWNYPNPFNNSTVISYELKQASTVSLSIYDLLGRRIEALVDTYQPAGNYHITWNACDVASGVYFYKLQAGDYAEMRRMMLLK